jgi:transport and Golgi organization protein 2
MCTVSVIAPGRALRGGRPLPLARIVFNRDERRDRPDAYPPAAFRAGCARAVMPIDPAGDGTWIAANDAGLVFAVLNDEDNNALPHVGRPHFGASSRGLIIPLLLDATTVDEALARAATLAWREYRPFRLFVFGDGRLGDVRPRRYGLAVLDRPLGSRFVATSSSLQPKEARLRRTQLFERVVVKPDSELQDLFHAYRWHGCPELSVRMSRPESCTVSRTIIERFVDRMVVRYETLDGDRRAMASTTVLSLSSARAGAA